MIYFYEITYFANHILKTTIMHTYLKIIFVQLFINPTNAYIYRTTFYNFLLLLTSSYDFLQFLTPFSQLLQLRTVLTTPHIFLQLTIASYCKKERTQFLVGMRQDTILAWNKHPFSRHRWSFMLGFFYHLSTLSHSLQLQMLMLYHRIVQNILSIMLSILMKLLVFYKTLHSHWKTSLPSKQGE